MCMHFSSFLMDKQGTCNQRCNPSEMWTQGWYTFHCQQFLGDPKISTFHWSSEHALMESRPSMQTRMLTYYYASHQWWHWHCHYSNFLQGDCDICWLRNKLGEEVCHDLPFIHAICGCDTSSCLYVDVIQANAYVDVIQPHAYVDVIQPHVYVDRNW
jgi:hypothetical protein